MVLPLLKCKCIKDTTVEGIKVGEIYWYEVQGNVYCIKYNETLTTYETLVGNRDWFCDYFAPVREDVNNKAICKKPRKQ